MYQSKKESNVTCPPINPSVENIEDDRNFIDRFRGLYNSETFSDIVLRVSDDRYYAHKFMLITASEVFEAMLNAECWREANQPEVALTEDAQCIPVFSNFLQYIYTGAVTLTTDSVLPILLLADKYGVRVLRESCVAYMSRHIVESPDTNRTLSWFQYAKMTGNQELVDKCLQFILSNFDVILKTPDWFDLQKCEIIEFLRSSDMVVINEYELWKKLELWLLSEDNVQDISTNLDDILPLLRFTMIPPKQLLQIESSSLYLNHRTFFVDKVNNAYRRHSLLFDEVEHQTVNEPYRNYSSEDYGLCHDLSLLCYQSVSKIESKVCRRCTVPTQFLPPTGTKHLGKSVAFDVEFWPRGYFTTYTLYGSYIGTQSEHTTLRVRRVTATLPAMTVFITLIIYGMKNGMKYVAFTYSANHTFTSESSKFEVANVISELKLMAENSSFLINGNLDAKLFLKIQEIKKECENSSHQ